MHRFVYLVKLKNVIIISAVLFIFIVYYCKCDSKNKLILTFVPFHGDPYFGFGDGSQKTFEEAGCEVATCEIVSDRDRVPIEDYDAILFHGFDYSERLFGVPRAGRPEQVYIYMSLEALLRVPLIRENFYSLSMTYRIDSDIPWYYFAIVDRVTGVDIAPAKDPDWITTALSDTGEAFKKEIAEIVNNKKNFIAWFVSNCNSDSGREAYAAALIAAGAKVDIYGDCGTLKCPKSDWNTCVDLVGQYYFYLAFENRLCEDYVSEKVVTALSSGTVPVILSGANLTKFLPPGSYIDASKIPAEALAKKLLALSRNPGEYSQYLEWRFLYSIQRRDTDFMWPLGKHPFCKLCSLLHNTTFLSKVRFQRRPDYSKRYIIS